MCEAFCISYRLQSVGQETHATAGWEAGATKLARTFASWQVGGASGHMHLKQAPMPKHRGPSSDSQICIPHGISELFNV